TSDDPAGECGVKSDDVVVTVTGQPTANASGPTAEDCDLVYNLSAVQSVSGSTGLWSVQVAGPGTISFGDDTQFTTTATATLAGTYTLRFTETVGSCISFDDIVVTYTTAPVADAGTGGDECDLDFTFGANPSVGSGQWSLVSGPGVITGTPDLTNATEPITVDTYGSYVFRWTETNGGCVDSEDITVNFYEQPTVSAANQSICSTSTTNVIISNPNGVSGTTFSWTIGTVTGTVSGQSASSGNVITQTLTSATGGTVEYIVTPSANGCSGSPITVVVTIDPIPVGTSIPAGTFEICSGSTLSITPSTPNAPSSTYSWLGDNGSGGNGIITDSPINNTDNPIDVTYTITPTGPAPTNCVGSPFTIVVTVNPNPVLTITNAAPSICSGDAVDITLNSPTLNHQINLVSVVYGAVTGGTATGPYTNGNKITETLNNNTSAAIDVTYEFNVTTSDGCPNGVLASQFATVTVSPAPAFLVTNNAPTICSEELSDIDITSTTVGAVIELINVVASSVQIVGTPAVGSTYLNGANISNQLRNPTNSVQTVTYTFEVKLNNCVNPTTQTVVITINPIPTLQTSVAAQTICDGDMTNIVLTNPNNVANTNFSWTVTPTAGITGASAGSGGPSTATIAQTLNNSGNAPGTVTYDIKPTANSCDGASRSIIVTVNPTPTLATTGNETICSGETTSIMLSNPNNVANTSFSWVVLNNINSVSGAVNGSGTAITQSLFVNSNSPAGSVTYRITPSANNCDGAFQDVVVTVNPLPVAFAGFDYAICADGEVFLTASLTGSATSGTWTGGNNASGFSNNPVINNEEITYSFDQTDSLAGFVTFTLTTNDPDGAGPCSSVSDQITVIINSLPVVSFTDLPDSIAENDAPINLFGSPSGGIFSGDGISGNSFNPAGGNVLEDNFVTYTFTDANGCTNSQTQKIFINGKPLIVIGNQNVQICETSAPDLLEADPTGGTWTGTGVVNIGGTNYEFRPADAGIGTHTLTYTFTDSNNATNSADLVYEVYPTAVVDFGPVNLCFDAPIAFNDSSTVNQTSVASNVSSIVEWNWQFFDSDNNIIGASDIQNPTIIFNSPGDKRIVLTVVSKAGTFTCSSLATKTITIGSVPDTRFKWESVCNGDFTAFIDDTILDIGSIINYEWNFDDGNLISGAGTGDASQNHGDGAETQGNFMDPEHRYVNVGDYDVTLTVSTNEGCTKSYTQNIDILPQTQISDFPYTINFDQSDGDWAEEVELQRDTTKISKNSWLYSNIGSGDISPKYAGDGFWWTGNNAGSYYNSEQSWVNGPCFDFSVVERPMISMKIASSTDKGFDGAVLQSSIDGGVTWQNIGNLDAGGINWYNSNSISAKPGGQAFGYGWTGSEDDIKIDASDSDVLNWIEVRHNLNGLKGQSNVLLRVAFGSNSDNSASQKNGFAFDDVYVGEKNRLVLIEHFTDSEFNSSRNMDNQLYDLGQAQLNDFGAIDFTTLQYHIDQSGNDLFNQDNPGDPSARSIYYGVSQAPATVADGLKYADDPTKLTTQIIDKRSLTDPLFNITIDTLSTTSDVLSVRAVFEANTVVNDIVTLQIAVVESDIVRNGVTYRNVLKKLLLGGEGQSVNTSWVAGQKQTITYDWNVDVEIFNPANLSIIAFVQNKTTREIYGTALIKGQIQDESTVTSIGEDLLDQVRQISIYPNPASNELNFQLNEKALEEYSWAIVDQRGISIMKGAMEFNPLGVQTINTSELKNGVYYVIIEAKDKPLIYRKLAIMNRK
ncbi:MAG TPA: PKD domain-containing protein, partial [Fulvivirga sp.]|nr:PKD domain-containing protein [Fulvivirga sp.]